MGDTRRLDRAHVDEPRVAPAESIEETFAVAEEHRDEADLHRVDEIRGEVLARGLRAPAERDVLAGGGLSRLREPDSIPSATKVNVVPPLHASGSRGWCVSTKTGAW